MAGKDCVEVFGTVTLYLVDLSLCGAAREEEHAASVDNLRSLFKVTAKEKMQAVEKIMNEQRVRGCKIRCVLWCGVYGVVVYLAS